MDCPHCGKGFHPQFQENKQAISTFVLFIYHQACPSCQKQILQFQGNSNTSPSHVMIPRFTIFPTNSNTARPAPPDVPDPYKQDFIEAVQILPLSPKASAALSRRIIQALLRDQARTKSNNLSHQIDEVITSKILPSYIADDLHAVRNVGNLAAHEIKDMATGEIIDVEPGEAEWTLDVAEAMLDFYFVEPAKSVKRRVELNEKLKAAGKPEVIEPSTSPAKVP